MKKTLTLITALVLVLCLTIGGTLAYYAWVSETATNTFEVDENAGIKVDNKENIEPDWDPEKPHPVTPGAAYAKNPQVQLNAATTVDVWVIFSVKEVNNWIDTNNDGEDDMQVILWETTNAVADYTEDMIAKGAPDDARYFAVKVNAKTAKNVYLFTDKGGVKETGSVLVNPDLTEDTLDLIEGNVQLIVNAWVLQDVDNTAAGAWAAYAG